MRPRLADDFAEIHERVDELRREREAPLSASSPRVVSIDDLLGALLGDSEKVGAPSPGVVEFVRMADGRWSGMICGNRIGPCSSLSAALSIAQVLYDSTPR